MTARQIISAGASHKYLEDIAWRIVVCRSELGDNALPGYENVLLLHGGMAG